MHVPFYRRLAAKISGLTVLLVTLTIGFFAVATYLRDHRALEKRFGLSLQRLVDVAAHQIDGEQHRLIGQPQDANIPAYRSIRRILRQVQRAQQLHTDHIYTFHISKDYRVQFAVVLKNLSLIGRTYEIVKANRRAFSRALRDKVATHTGIYRDPHGMWISAYAPILDRKGQIAGVLEADVQIDQFYNALQRELQWLLLLSLSAVLLAILMSILFARRLNRDLNQLCQGVDAIKLNDYQYHIKLQRKDELGFVAAQFNEMADVIAERVDMLKYLPKHTLEAIARRSRTGTVHNTEYVKGTVVFADLRGYSSMSEALSPEQIIDTLNIYLQKHAEIVDRYGGVIDKMIGDGVLAVFQDFAHVHRAVEAALDIQKSVIQLNETAEFPQPLALGVGVATGYLVFGDVGSELRKERILLGSEVNLAARLSNLAAAGEVVISDQVRHILAKSVEISRSEQVEIKGLPEMQVIHVVHQVKSFNAQQTWTV